MKKLIIIIAALAISISSDIYATPAPIIEARINPDNQIFENEFDFQKFILEDIENSDHFGMKAIEKEIEPQIPVTVDFNGFRMVNPQALTNAYEPIGAIDFENYIIRSCERPASRFYKIEIATEILIRNMH
ncbi:MAG: hypothetical protein ACLFQX_10165 [Candidatus Kapaibacterium sp.]